MTEGEARAFAALRVESFLATLGRLGPDDLMRTALGHRDEREREAAREEAERLAREAGLDDLLAEARATVRERVLRAFDASLYRPTMVGLNWGLSEGTTDDRVATIRACEDAITAAVVEPFAQDATLASLDSPFELIERGRTVDTAFDLTRATADALDRGRFGGRLGAGLIGIVVVAGALAIVVGIWQVGVATVFAALAVAAVLRSRSRPEST